MMDNPKERMALANELSTLLDNNPILEQDIAMIRGVAIGEKEIIATHVRARVSVKHLHQLVKSINSGNNEAPLLRRGTVS